MNKKQKKMLARILISAAVYAVLLVLEHAGVLEKLPHRGISLVLFLVPYLIIGYDIIYKAARNISHGQVFDENFLMMLATFGAFGVGEYSEGVAVMLFYQVGELFQSYAVGKSRQSIADMMDICPEYANVEENGQLVQVDPDEVEIDTVIVIKPGERIPLDGIVEDGESFLDTAALTGESVPRKAAVGDEVISGCVNGSGTLKVRVTKPFEDSTVTKILELVENASSKKAKTENFITRFARYYTPVVTIGAVLLAILPPLILGGNWAEWIQRACIFLVISCPCALVISVPLGFFGGIGASSRLGILVKGSNYLEAVAEMTTIVFDKTGTLTKGEFKVTEVRPADAASGVLKLEAMNMMMAGASKPENISGIEDFGKPKWIVDWENAEVAKINENEQQLLELATLAEGYSNHPIAVSIREAYGKPLLLDRVTDTEEIAGHGIKTKIDGKEVLAGNAKLLAAHGIVMQERSGEQASGTQAAEIKSLKSKVEVTELASTGTAVAGTTVTTAAPEAAAGTVVYLAREGRFLGSITISDTVKDGAKEALSDMKKVGVKKTVMLTGDRKEAADAVAAELGIDEVHAQLLPNDKVGMVEKLLAAQNGKEKLAFVGDGINDAPVLTRADIGIAMGSMGSDAAIEAADIVLMDDDVKKIASVVKIAKKTLRIVRQNIVFALAVKALVLLLGAFGVANMWEAVFADVGVSVIAILNAMRTLRVK